MNPAVILTAGIVLGIFTADALHTTARSLGQWMVTRRDQMVSAALTDDPLEAEHRRLVQTIDDNAA